MHHLKTCALLLAAGPAMAGPISVNYNTNYAGGNNSSGPSGLAARATFEVSGDMLAITLQNVSTGAPASAEISDVLLTSVGFTMPTGTSILSAFSANIGAGSAGVGRLSGSSEGDSVANDWVYTNSGGGDIYEDFSQVITTSNGSAHNRTGFGSSNKVGGPFGGMISESLVDNFRWNGNKQAVNSSIVFRVRTSRALTQIELSDIAFASVVEFGSDYQYLGTDESPSSSPIPLPSPALLAGASLGGLIAVRRRR